MTKRVGCYLNLAHEPIDLILMLFPTLSHFHLYALCNVFHEQLHSFRRLVEVVSKLLLAHHRRVTCEASVIQQLRSFAYLRGSDDTR